MHSPKDRMAMMMAGMGGGGEMPPPDSPVPQDAMMQGGPQMGDPMAGGGEQGAPQLQPDQIMQLIELLKANGVDVGGGMGGGGQMPPMGAMG
jgi:hypothetical protein